MRIDDFTKERETEKAVLLKFYSEELGSEVSAWFPKSKVDFKGSSADIVDSFWETKRAELANPPAEPMVAVTVANPEESGNAWKLVLDYSMKTVTSDAWMFVPKSDVTDIEEADGGAKVYVKEWWWKNGLAEVKAKILEFYNSEEQKYSAGDIVILNDLEEI